MWKKLGKLAAEVAIQAFLEGFLNEAGSALAKRLIPEVDKDKQKETETETER